MLAFDLTLETNLMKVFQTPVCHQVMQLEAMFHLRISDVDVGRSRIRQAKEIEIRIQSGAGFLVISYGFTQ